MKAEKLQSGKVHIEVESGELHVLQFMSKFLISLDSKVFTGRFMRRVRRIHEVLEGVE